MKMQLTHSAHVVWQSVNQASLTLGATSKTLKIFVTDPKGNTAGAKGNNFILKGATTVVRQQITQKLYQSHGGKCKTSP